MGRRDRVFLAAAVFFIMLLSLMTLLIGDRTSHNVGMVLAVVIGSGAAYWAVRRYDRAAFLLTQKDTEGILRFQPGITFRYEKNREGEYIYTLWEGELAYQIGLLPEQVIGKTLGQVFPLEFDSDIRLNLEAAYKERRTISFEVVLQGKLCTVTLRHISNPRGKEYVVGYCSDISWRKETEEELLRVKEMLESFFNNTSDAIGVFDLSGNISFVNQAFVDMFGWSREECIGQSGMIIIPPDLQEEVRNLHEAVEYGGHISGYETKRISKSGELLDISITISPIRDYTGKTIALGSVSRDITESKLVEAALRKSETKYRLIAENMTDIISVLDHCGVIEYISPSCHALLGADPEQFIGTSIFDWMYLEEESILGEFYHKSLSVSLGEIAELKVKHTAGHWIVLEVSSRWIPDSDNGNIPSVLIVARDVTERKQAEELLLKSEKLSVVGQLAAGVAHEIRNPLTSLKGFLQLLQKRADDNAFFYEVMLSELDRINTIVSEFLMLSKPQTAKMERKDVVKITLNVVSFLESQALLSNVQISTCIEAGPEVFLNCDENQLKQVFINLLKNAVEAMPGGGVVQVSVLLSGQDRVIIRFADQGQGIPAEQIQKLGEPFYTTKEKGTGLGLMVSFRIIEDHGGKINITSQVNEGTTFDVELPLQAG